MSGDFVEMDELFARRLLERIDEKLQVGSLRAMTSRSEFLDTLLELRILVSDLIALEHLDASGDARKRRAGSRRFVHPRTG